MLTTTRAKDIKNFIDQEKIDQEKKSKRTDREPKYLLSLPKALREAIRIEAIKENMSMSSYICKILTNRQT